MGQVTWINSRALIVEMCLPDSFADSAGLGARHVIRPALAVVVAPFSLSPLVTLPPSACKCRSVLFLPICFLRRRRYRHHHLFKAVVESPPGFVGDHGK
jgi:hypothetical protein